MDGSFRETGSLKHLDSKRTEAHNRMLTSAEVFIDVLEDNSDFKKRL